MKAKAILIISITALIIYGIFSFIKMAIDNRTEVVYCGKVVKTYMTNASYKTSESRHVVFYSDSLKRNIDVRVNNQLFVNISVGERVCFGLDKMQLNE